MKTDRLGRIAVSVALVTVLLVTATAAAVAFRPLRAVLGFDVLAAADYSVGQAADIPADLLADRGMTAVLFLRSSCGGCQSAAPALKRLVADISDSPAVRIVMITPPGRLTEELEFGTGLGLRPDQIVSLDMRTLRLSRVPTVMAVGANGIVEAVASGTITDESLADIRRLVARPH